MSGSDREQGNPSLGDAFALAVALAICCVLVGVIAYKQGLESERRYQSPHRHAEGTEADAKRSCAGTEPGAMFECVYKKVEASEETARAEQDLTAQQRAASSALIAAIISLVTLIVSGVGVWFVKRTLDATLEAVEDTGKATKAMERQNDLAEDTAKRQLRAYVALEEVVTSENSPTTRKIQIKWVNSGQTPARNAIAFAQWAFFPYGVPSDFDFPVSHYQGGDFGNDIGPSQAVYSSCENDFSFSYLPALAARENSLILWASVDYTDAFGQERRTEFCSQLVIEALANHEYGWRWAAVGEHNGMDDGCLKKPYADCTANDDGRHRA